MEADEDVHSLLSIPLSSLLNFQRGQQGQQQPQQPRLQYDTIQEHHYLFGGSTTTGAGASLANFNSQSSADSAHFSSQELGFETSDMEIDSHLLFPRSSVVDKPNHSEVEKMRRDRMNGSIGEMAVLVPLCRSASRKLDKLTILRLAVQHIKLVRARAASMMQIPAEIFGVNELAQLLTRKSSLQGFVLVLECDRARILCATNCDNSGIPGACLSSSDLIGLCFLDMIHPKDVELVKQQLATIPEPAQRQWLGDGCPSPHSLRRRFLCRFRTVISAGPLSATRKTHTRQYVYLNCSGFLHWSDPAQPPIPSAAAGASQSDESQQQHPISPAQSTCLTLVCRPAEPLIQTAMPMTIRCSQDWQFTAKLTLDACFTWIDQRVASILGHLPQDLLNTSLYELVSRDDVNRLSVAHRSALKGTRSRVACRVRCAWQLTSGTGGVAGSSGAAGEALAVDPTCQLSLVSFINPCSGRAELLSLTCAITQPPSPATGLQHQMQPQHQVQLEHQRLSFPSIHPSSSTASEAAATLPMTQAAAASGSAAIVGTRIASELLPPPPPQLLPSPTTILSAYEGAAAAPSTETAAVGGWLALAQLLSAGNNGHHHYQLPESATTASAVGTRVAEAAFVGDESLATTRMCLLGADGGFGEEPDYSSMVWPL